MATQPVLANAGSDGSDAEFYEILVEMGLLDADANSRITDALRAAVLRLRGKHGLDVRFNEHRQHEEDRDAHGQASVSAVADALAASITDDQGSSVCVEAGLADALGSKSTSSSSKASASKAGIADNQTPGANHEAGGEASIAASASRKTGRTTGSSDDEDLINPFKKKKLNASSNVLAVRDRFSARDVEEPLADVSSQEFKMLKCLVISNWLDLDGSAFQHELRHLKDLDRHLLRVSTTAKMRSVNMDDLLGYRDAVLAEMKRQDMDEDDGGFPGVGSAADEMDEAWGWETTNFMELLILLCFYRFSDLTLT
jgi:hypothetical protein